MNIGIYIENYYSKDTSGIINKLIINRLCELMGDHSCYLISKLPINSKNSLPGNLSPIHIPSSILKVLNPKWAYQAGLQKAIKKSGIEAIITFNTFIQTTIPQWQVMHNSAALKKAGAKHFELLKGLVLTSFQQYQLAKLLGPVANKLLCIEGLKSHDFCPITFDSKLDTREKYTDNKEFFLCSDPDLNETGFVLLLKAFSIFKQMQQSSWKLLVSLRSKKQMAVLEDSLSAYKYRYDVVLLHVPEQADLAQITASAYALISVSETTTFPIPVFEAFACELPVIAPPLECMRPYHNAVLISEGNDPVTLAEKIMQLYKNEGLRDTTIEKGIRLAEQFDPEQSLEELVRQVLQA